MATTTAGEVRTRKQNLHPQLEAIQNHFHYLKMDADGVVFGLNDDQFNWRPPETQWSLAQYFDHMNRLLRRALEDINLAVKEARAKGKLAPGPFSYGYLSRWLFEQVERGAVTRLEPPATFEPTQEFLQAEKTYKEFQFLVDAFQQTIEQSDGVDLAEVKLKTPFSKWIRLPLGLYLLAIPKYCRQQLKQARQLRMHRSFPSPEKTSPMAPQRAA